MSLSLTSARFLIIKAACCALVSACATTPEPIIQVQEVYIPVPVSCVPDDFPGPLAYPDSLDVMEAADYFERVQLLRRARILRRDRIADLEDVIEACR